MSKQQRIETLERNVFGPTGLKARVAKLEVTSRKRESVPPEVEAGSREIQEERHAPFHASRAVKAQEEINRLYWKLDELRAELKGRDWERARLQSYDMSPEEANRLRAEVDRLTAEAKERERHIEELEARFAKARQFFTPGQERANG